MGSLADKMVNVTPNTIHMHTNAKGPGLARTRATNRGPQLANVRGSDSAAAVAAAAAAGWQGAARAGGEAGNSIATSTTRLILG